MKRLLVVVLVVLVAVGAPAPAGAYLKFGVRVGNRTIDVKWAQQPIPYFVNDRSIVDVSAAQLRDAIVRAFDTWQAVSTASVRTQFQGMTSAPPGFQDGRTTFGFLDRPDLERVLGATSFLLDANTGAIVEADVFFNTRFRWSVASSGEADRVDVESVALHEIGHLLGLGHSAIGETEILATGGRRVIASGAIMFPIAMSAGVTTERQLTRDDIAGISDLYPAGNASDFSSISGRVLKSGRGVFGAHVVAFNIETGALVGNFSLNEEGVFVIAGLDPGPHVLRVEPVDDAEPDLFFMGPIDVNFRVGYAPQVIIALPAAGSNPVDVTVRPK